MCLFHCSTDYYIYNKHVVFYNMFAIMYIHVYITHAGSENATLLFSTDASVVTAGLDGSSLLPISEQEDVLTSAKESNSVFIHKWFFYANMPSLLLYSTLLARQMLEYAWHVRVHTCTCRHTYMYVCICTHVYEMCVNSTCTYMYHICMCSHM